MTQESQEHELAVNGNEEIDTTFDLGVSDDESSSSSKKTTSTTKTKKNGKVVPKLSPTIKSKSTNKSKGGLFLKGCVCLVDVHIDDGDTSTSDVWKEKLTAMGARVVSQASSSLTHLVFKDGDNKRLNKLREKEGVECVSPQWIESCESAGKRVSESDFAAVDGASGNKRKRTSGAARSDDKKKKKKSAAKDTAESDEGEKEDEDEDEEKSAKKKKPAKTPVLKRAAGRRSFVSPALKNKNETEEEEEAADDKKNKSKKKTVAAKKSPAAKKRKADDESEEEEEDDEEKKPTSKKKTSSVKKSPAKKAKTNSGESDITAKDKKKKKVAEAKKKTKTTPTKKKSPTAPKRRKSKSVDDIDFGHAEDDDDDEDVEDLQLYDDMGSEDEMLDEEENEIDNLEDPTVLEQLWTDTNIREDLEGPEFKHLLAKNVVEFSSVSNEDKEAMMGILRSFKETKLCTASRNTEFRGQRFSHLIIGEAKRTIKVLFAIAFGAAIVRPKYIFDAVEMDALPDDKEYLCEEYAEAIERSRQANTPLSEDEMEEEEQEEEGEAAGEKISLKQQPFLKGVRIFIAGNTTPDAPLLGRLVKLCGGEVVKSVRAADYAILGRFAQRANYNRVTVLSEKWLLDGVEHYRMPEEVDQYVLNDAEIESLFVVDKKKPARKSSSSNGGRKKQQTSKNSDSQTDSQKKNKSKSNEEEDEAAVEEEEEARDGQEMENGDE